MGISYQIFGLNFKQFHIPFLKTAKCENYCQDIAEVKEEYSCEYGTPKFFALCGLGGLISCGLTHTSIVPLDLVKCRIQINPVKYKGIGNSFSLIIKEEGFRALAKGWAPTAVGYSLQGLGKFGFYELFKVIYSDALGEELAYTWRTSLYLAASASAEFFADIMLAPMEATKVRIQTMPDAPSTLGTCAPMIWKTEGIRGFYKVPPTSIEILGLLCGHGTWGTLSVSLFIKFSTS